MRNKRGKLNYINFLCDVDLCDIDMVIRIDEETYDCEKCALVDTVDTVSTVREGMVDKSICPMIMEEEVKILR